MSAPFFLAALPSEGVKYQGLCARSQANDKKSEQLPLPATANTHDHVRRQCPMLLAWLSVELVIHALGIGAA